ncbi:MAG: alpha/beta hydrolase [Tannerellaceae bacterium]|jgi:predicted esterase|nr:alpha/beta hydrolase [Tannerellaceae bacterium]
MKNSILFLFVLVLVSSCTKQTSPKPGKVDKQTFVFSIKGTDTLRLDKYDIPSKEINKPCVLFVFGGGFAVGSRGEEFNVDYLKKLAEKGYVGIGIDYRLGLKDIKNIDVSGDPANIIGLLFNAIHIAVEDLFDATDFVYKQAEAWGIDKTKIIANGSSAGAVTVLQGEYIRCNKAALSKRLPDGFSYGGIIAFAGAVAGENGDLTWPVHPAPIQLFHGDADKNVPFNKALLGDAGLYGSNYIAGQLNKMQSPCYFYEVENAAHEIAGSPMLYNLDQIGAFINTFVLNSEPLMIHTAVKQIGKPELEKEFDFMDYINTNYN